MLYDLVCFILCLGVIIYACISRSRLVDWPVIHIIFACQVVYGYLSAPFFFLKMPLTAQVLAHVKPTAYDRQGRCRKPMRYQRKQQLSEDELIEDSEAYSLRDKLKAILFDPHASNAQDADHE